VKTIFETRFAKVGETSSHYQSARITSSAAACHWAKHCLGEYFSDKLDQEEFLIAILDTKFFVRRVVRITRGTLDASLVHPREVFRPAIADAASAILCIHNHPSGDPTPSPQDHQITERLREAGRILGINVLDHIVVGDYAVSLAEVVS
jgi:DNA repair protein RadC